MCDLLRECLDAGAVGLSTSYVDVEEDFQPVPCRWAEHSELEALCAVLGERGRMLQIVHEFFDAGLTVRRVELLGRPVAARTASRPRSRRCSTAAPLRDATDQVMEAVEPGVGRRRPGVAAGADPADRHQLDARPAQHHVPGHPRLVAGAVPARRRTRSSPRSPTRRPGNRWSAASTCWRSIPDSGLNPNSFLVRDVALEQNRDLVGRTLGDIAAETGHGPRRPAHRPRRRGGPGHLVHPPRHRPQRRRSRRRAARPPARARRRERRRRARRLVRHLRRHRVPGLAVRARHRRRCRSRRR